MFALLHKADTFYWGQLPADKCIPFLAGSRQRLFENLRMLPHAPGVQMQPIPEDAVQEDSGDEEEEDPEKRISSMCLPLAELHCTAGKCTVQSLWVPKLKGIRLLEKHEDTKLNYLIKERKIYDLD